MQETEQNSSSRLVSTGTFNRFSGTPEPKYISKKREYRLLIKLIKAHKLAVSTGRGYNIQAIVKALNIDPKTARKWLETPKVQEAIIEQMEYFIRKMEEVGKDDWRMWAKQVEMAQGLVEDKAIKNQVNVQIIQDEKRGIFRVQDAEDE